MRIREAGGFPNNDSTYWLFLVFPQAG